MDKKIFLITILLGVVGAATIGLWFYFSYVAVTPVLRTGIYTLEGYNSPLSVHPDYRGEVSITKTKEVYKLEWRIGGQEYKGVGILEGNILSVGYVYITDEDIRDVGVVSYRVVNETKLEGKWSSILSQETGREILIWQDSF